MPNKKGGYKIVSLNGLDLVGESLAIVGLYDKLANSYGKPILVSGIVINGEKKKNAFVQVEVLDGGIKINDLYGYDLLVEEDGDITVSANPQELPNTADASAGQVLKLDAQKKPVWENETEELPSTASASQGNALLLDAEKKPVWGAISGGTKLYKHTVTLHEYPTATANKGFNITYSGSTPQLSAPSSLPSYANKTLTFITTRATPLSVGSAISTYSGFEIIRAELSLGSGSSYKIMNIVNSFPTTFELYYDGGIVYSAVGNILVDSDTVTEL